MEREQLKWRSFADQGPIVDQWNNPGTPTYYVLDTDGFIRYKWIGYPGRKAIDTALETLIHEAERTGN